MLAYFNQASALFHIPSLGQQVDVMITHLEIQKSAKFDSHDGLRDKLLDSFCDYSNLKNPLDDEKDPRHWDIGILVTGLDMWTQNNGIKNFHTLGVARTKGMCHSKFSCAVVEFGVVGAIGTFYPTTGFSAAYTLAHEIGHTLGMFHDGEDGCDRDGYIMSRSRGVHGQTKWSKCSERTLASKRTEKKLKCLQDRPQKAPLWDHNSTNGVPGYFIPVEEQCKFYYKGKEGASAANDPRDPTLCQHLQCTDGQKTESTGPPLEGTSCGGDGTHWCREGTCVPVQPAKWGGWQEGLCQSACVAESVGYRENTRQCLILQVNRSKNK